MRVLLIFVFIIILIFLIIVSREHFSDLEWQGDIDYKQNEIQTDNVFIEGNLIVDKLNLNDNKIDTHEDDLTFLSNLPTKTNEYIAIGNIKAYEGDFYALKNYWPVGTIVAYEGRLEDIDNMKGWALCNGENGTPDLRDRFIMGANSVEEIGLAGGEETHMIKPHELPKHKHTYDLLVAMPINYENNNISKNQWFEDVSKIYNIPKKNIQLYSKNSSNLGIFLRPSAKVSDFDNTNSPLTCVGYQKPDPNKPLYLTSCKKQKNLTNCNDDKGYVSVSRMNPTKNQAKKLLSAGLGDSGKARTRCAGDARRRLCQNNDRIIAGFSSNEPDFILPDFIDQNRVVEPRNQLPKYYSLFYIIKIDENIKEQNFVKERPAPTKAPTPTTTPLEERDTRYMDDDDNDDDEEEEEEEEEEEL